MLLNEEKMDLFSVPQGYYLAHCISGDYTLGAGVAKQIDAVYGMKQKLRKRYPIPDGEKYAHVGEALLVDNVFNLVTKGRCFERPTLETLEEALMDMALQMDELDIKKLAIPLLGCGKDRLDWDDVRDLIEDIFGEMDVEILVCRL